MFLKVSRSFVFILIASSGFASVSMMAGCCRKILEWFLGKMTSVKYHYSRDGDDDPNHAHVLDLSSVCPAVQRRSSSDLDLGDPPPRVSV